MSTLGLDRYADRCARGFDLATQHPALCDCADVGEWGIFTAALRAAAKNGRVRQDDVRPLIRGRIEHKHIGQMYRRAKREGVLVRVGKEPSGDFVGRNTHHDSPIYELRSAS